MRQYPKPLAKLIGELAKLPGIGYKTAQRLAFHILSLEDNEAGELALAITDAKREMKYCQCMRQLDRSGPLRHMFGPFSKYRRDLRR